MYIPKGKEVLIPFLSGGTPECQILFAQMGVSG